MDSENTNPVPSGSHPDHGDKSNAWLLSYADATHDTWQQRWFEIEGQVGNDYLDGWHTRKKMVRDCSNEIPEAH